MKKFKEWLEKKNQQVRNLMWYWALLRYNRVFKKMGLLNPKGIMYEDHPQVRWYITVGEFRILFSSILPKSEEELAKVLKEFAAMLTAPRTPFDPSQWDEFPKKELDQETKDIVDKVTI